MKIVVLVATYQGESYIAEQLESLLRQTLPVDIIIRDDASKDNTLEVLEQYEEKYPQITIVRHLSRGEGSMKHILRGGGGSKKNFLLLLEYAKTLDYEYIMCCDQDDIWYPEKVEQTVECMRGLENQYGKEVPLLVHTDLELVAHDGTFLAASYWKYNGFDPYKNSLPRLLMDNTVTGCTMMINRTLLLKGLPAPEEAILHDIWFALVARAFGHIGIVDHPTMGYRQHAINLVGAAGKESFVQKAIIAITMTLSKERRTSKISARVAQAGSFYNQYSSSLSTEDKDAVKCFSELFKLPLHKRLVSIFKYGFYKQRVVKTIGVLLVLLLPTGGIYKKS